MKYLAPVAVRKIPVVFGVALLVRTPAVGGDKLPGGIYHDRGDAFLVHTPEPLGKTPENWLPLKD